MINAKKQLDILIYNNSEVKNCSSESEGELEILFYCLCLSFYIIKDWNTVCRKEKVIASYFSVKYVCTGS